MVAFHPCQAAEQDVVRSSAGVALWHSGIHPIISYYEQWEGARDIQILSLSSLFDARYGLIRGIDRTRTPAVMQQPYPLCLSKAVPRPTLQRSSS